MSRPSDQFMFSHELICVVDTSVLIEFKRIVKIDEQWDLLMLMGDLVADGRLAFPRQVAKELAYARHPDAPGAWIGSAKARVCHPQPDEQSLVKVLGVAEQLVDPEVTADREVADPYVAAMACEIAARHRGCQVVVATGDTVDRLPVKLSLATACDRLGVAWWPAADFVDWVRSCRR